MKYYLIVGEASGDLHASNLMAAIRQEDPEADFRFFGGDLMTAVGGKRVKHYRELAYMGFIPVLLHLPAIFANMRLCKEDIVQWHPDVVILVDYPGFNLGIAKFVRAKTRIPVFYYISPKIWAWKTYRIKNIKRDVDELFSILPFEVDFYRKYDYPIHYVGNPCVDAVAKFRETTSETRAEFLRANGLDPSRPIIALLAGSRKQEIKDNLPDMIRAASAFPEYQMVLAGAPGIDPFYYGEFIQGTPVKVVYGQTYPLLANAHVALVTSGTATLETALFRVPQVVCYYVAAGRLASYIFRHFFHIRYISLVNLIGGREIVQELFGARFTEQEIDAELRRILLDREYRQSMLNGYDEVIARLGKPGAAEKAAECIIKALGK